MATWANPEDAPSRSKPIESWCASLPKLPLPPTAVSHQPMPSWSWICSVNHCQLLPIQQENMCASLNPPGASSCSEMKLFYVENAPSQVTHAGETSTPTDVRQLPRKGGKNEWKDEKAEGAAESSPHHIGSCHDPIFTAPSWFNAPPGLGLPAGAGPDYWRNELLYRGGDIEKHPAPKTRTSWNAGLCALRLSVMFMAATRCAVFLWAWLVWLVWWLNGFSLHERLIFERIFHICSRRSSSAKCGIF